MTSHSLTAGLQSWTEPSVAVDNAVAAMLVEIVGEAGHALHGDTLTGRGRHVVVSTRGVDVVRVVSMRGPVAVVADPPEMARLYLDGNDVTDALDWIDDVVAAIGETLADADSRGPIQGWLCVLDADWSGRNESLVVHGHRIVRYGVLAHELAGAPATSMVASPVNA